MWMDTFPSDLLDAKWSSVMLSTTQEDHPCSGAKTYIKI